jgi:SNF2 family DNA or RNA helicase
MLFSDVSLVVVGSTPTSTTSLFELLTNALHNYEVLEPIECSTEIQVVGCRPADDGTFEYFVKNKYESYIRCKWKPISMIKYQAIQTFHSRNPASHSGAIFDQSYPTPQTEIDRIIGVGIIDGRTAYLVYWKDQPYSMCTWEFESFFPRSEIKKFNAGRKPPPLKERYPTRPDPSTFSIATIDQLHLRLYQVEGLRWLIYNWYNRRNSILADEMGLGKTIQIIAFLQYLLQVQHNRGPFLVVAPLSTVSNWKREVEKWSNLYSVLYHGDNTSYNILHQYELNMFENGAPIDGVYKFNVMITTYETLIRRLENLQKVHWQVLIIDEAHLLKNSRSKIYESVMSLKVEHKIAITAHPLQNSIAEIWSLLNFINAENIGTVTEFEKLIEDSNGIAKLHGIMRPYLLRRLREEITV